MERLSLSFETVEAAKQKTEITLEKIRTGQKIAKKHCGDFSQMTWDKEALKREFENLPEDTVVNWSDIARRYNINDLSGKTAKNGAQIAKEWLIRQDIDTDKFATQKKLRAVRRKKLTVPGGETTFPTFELIQRTREKLKMKIEEGKCSIREIIVPQKYQKLTVQNGQLMKKVFWVEGGKYH